MGLLDKFFKRSSHDLSYAHSSQSINTLPQINYYHLQREDGSTISIAPEVDSMGYQLYSQIYNSRTDEIKNIPRWPEFSFSVHFKGFTLLLFICLNLHGALGEIPSVRSHIYLT